MRNSRSSRKLPALASSFNRALLAERIRPSPLRVCDEPTRSSSPVSNTRSSLACWRMGTLAISSRNSVPPLANSKPPIRSVRASVNAPFTCPKISLSKVPSGKPPALTATSAMRARGEAACSSLATISLPVPCSPESRMELGMNPHQRDQPLVLPGLLDKIPCPPLDRFNRQVNVAPGGHHNHRHPRIELLNPSQQIQPLLTRGGVAGVVQV